MKIRASQLTNTGERSLNQDRLGQYIGEHSACFVVCDGVASLPGGELAARIATDTVLQQFAISQTITREAAEHCIEEAHARILEYQKTKHGYSRMSSTIVSLFLDLQQHTALWSHLGDSRLYQFRRGHLLHVTKDHSLVQQLADAGHSSQGIASNLLMQALGIRTPITPDISPITTIEDGDVFLLCTDGFWHEIDAKIMERSLRISYSPDAWIQSLRQEFDNDRTVSDKQDNFSAITVWIGSPEEITLFGL